jgi:hypothetical protein
MRHLPPLGPPAAQQPAEGVGWAAAAKSSALGMIQLARDDYG